MVRIAAAAAFALLLTGGTAWAQARPVVHMNVTRPDGQVTQISAPESGLTEVTLKDGTDVGVRPTIQDAKPWTKVTVTFFRMPTATHAAEEMGAVDVKTGGAAVTVRTTPSLKVAVTSVSDGNSVPTT